MKHIYDGEFTNPQVDYELRDLHAKIHRFLIYKEESDPNLSEYFVSVQKYIASLNELLYEPKSLISLMATIQEAKREYEKGEKCNDRLYRKFVLDAHSKVDTLKGGA